VLLISFIALSIRGVLAIGGWIAQGIGYSAMLVILGSVALGTIALWLGFAAVLKPACARHGSGVYPRVAAPVGAP
jgi:hypothetical protein